MRPPIYLDYNATTPVDPAVLAAMLPYLQDRFGNASSAHPYGYAAREAIEQARSHVAQLLGARPDQITFTGGASETNNLVLKGLAFAHLGHPAHIVTTVIEHPAVLVTLAYLRRRFGVEQTLVPVDQHGLVDPDDIAAAIRRETILVSVMHANNETGTIQPVAEIGAICRQRGVPFHVDAAQTAGKIPIDVEATNVDLLSVAGHELYAPKGIGALYCRAGIELDPLVHGSSQEHGMRAGTENVAGMVALGAACALAGADLPAETGRLTRLRDRLHDALTERVRGLQLNGHREARLPNTLNVSFPGCTGATVLAFAPGVAASTGSACHSAVPEPSPVLMAMNLPPARALGAVRLSVGRPTTEAEIDEAACELVNAWRQVAPGIVPA